MRKGFPPAHMLAYHEGTITAAQLKNILSENIVLLPSVGEGAFVEFIAMAFKYNFGTLAFENGEDLVVRYIANDGENRSKSIPSTMLEAAEGSSGVVLPNSVAPLDAGVQLIGATVNKSGLILTNVSGSADWETGDGTIDYRILYRVHNI